MGLAFIQSYAVDKRLSVKDLGYERIDVVAGAVMTGVIGFFVIACAATLHVAGVHVETRPTPPPRSSRWRARPPRSCSAIGFIGAALLAIAVVPLSTAYSISEDGGRRADLDAGFRQERTFYVGYMVSCSSRSVVLTPGLR